MSDAGKSVKLAATIPNLRLIPTLTKLPQKTSGRAEIDAFVARVREQPRAASRRLIFALDATASREATWDRACALHAEMFLVTSELGGLNIQLCYFRGYRELRASPWVSEPAGLLQQMTGVRCLGGLTQLGRVLQHALRENKSERLGAVVFVGDAFEEDIDRCAEFAGQLGMLKVPVFMFQEGGDPVTTRAFKQLAELSGGAHCHLGEDSAALLRELLQAVAAYVAGGHEGLKRLGRISPTVKRLTQQLR